MLIRKLEREREKKSKREIKKLKKLEKNMNLVPIRHSGNVDWVGLTQHSFKWMVWTEGSVAVALS